MVANWELSVCGVQGAWDALTKVKGASVKLRDKRTQFTVELNSLEKVVAVEYEEK